MEKLNVFNKTNNNSSKSSKKKQNKKLTSDQIKKQQQNETPDYIDLSDELFQELSCLVINLTKNTYEQYGINLGKTKANLVYHNYLVQNPLSFQTNSAFLGGAPLPISSKQARENARILISILIKEFGLADFQAAAFAGVFEAESGLNPASFNVLEKTGRGNPGQSQKTAQLLAATAGYGAGIAQWTFKERKQKAVQSLNSATGKNYNWQQIEAIPFDDQVRMVMFELSPNFINQIKTTRSIEAAVDLILRGYENGGSGNGKLASVAQMNSYAGGYSGLMQKRVGYAKTMLAAYKQK